jgi:DNA-directed RNA polymerase specialized sigma24 family protein
MLRNWSAGTPFSGPFLEALVLHELEGLSYKEIADVAASAERVR